MEYSLGNICKYRKGKIDVASLKCSNYISTENMLPNKGGIVEASSLPTTSQVQVYKYDDVLVSNIRPYFKKIWKAEFDGGCSNDVLVFESNLGIDKDFLYYVLADDAFFTYAMTTSKGTKMPRGDKTALMQYNIPKIGLLQQRKIASVLKAFDKKITINNKINDNLAKQMVAIFMNIRDSSVWSEQKMENIMCFYDYMRKPLSARQRDGMKRNYPYYGAASIVDYVENYIFDGTYILISEDGANVVDKTGHPLIQYAYGKFWVNNHAHIVQGANGFSEALLFALLKTLNIQSIVTGAAQPKVNQANLRNFMTFLPKPDEAEQLSAILEPFFNQMIKNDKENALLTELRDTLLPKLMSGKLDVSNLDL